MDIRTQNVPIEIPGYGSIMAQAVVIGVPTGERDVKRTSIKDIMSFDEINKIIESIAASLKATMDKVAPDEASVEFGITLAVEAGQLSALLVQGNASSSLNVTLTWKKEVPISDSQKNLS